MGELVPTSKNSFGPATTLTWDNVKFLENKEALIFIPYSKTTGFNGKVVDVFTIELMGIESAWQQLCAK